MIARRKWPPKYIYALCEPCEEFKPRYVGLTMHPKKRYSAHPHKPVTAALGEWFASINNKPRMVILETLTECIGFGYDQERWWIRHLLAQGHSLFNQAGTDDTRFQNRLVWQGREARRQIRRLFTKQYHSPKPVPAHTRHVTAHGKTQSKSAWARELGITRQAIDLRLKRHPPEIALQRTLPKKHKAVSQ